MDYTYSCGLFNVSSSIINGAVDECVVMLVLTVGGTGVPLLTIILCLLCIMCCMCRRLRSRNVLFDVSKAEEANGGSEMTGTGGVQMKELDYNVVDEDMAGPLYDEVKRVEEITIAIDDVDAKSKLEDIPEDMPQPYEEVASVTKKPDPPVPEVREYATPERTLTVSDDGVSKRASMPPPPKPDDYSTLFEDQKQSSARNSMSLLPEGMYSSIGEIRGPPLPPPLATEHVPIEIRISLDNLAEREAKQDEESQEEPSKADDKTALNEESEQILADAIEEMEKFGSMEVLDGEAPFYTNVTLQQREVGSREQLNTSESEAAYYNTREKLFASQEDKVEIKQDLYVNF